MPTSFVIVGGIILLILVILTLYFSVPTLLHSMDRFPLEDKTEEGIQWPSIVIESPRTWTIDQNQDQDQSWTNTNTDPKLAFLRNCRNLV